MNRGQSFLITYGLHNFVTYTLNRGEHSFFIKSKEGRKLVSHAKALIEASFGKTAEIQVG